MDRTYNEQSSCKAGSTGCKGTPKPIRTLPEGCRTTWKRHISEGGPPTDSCSSRDHRTASITLVMCQPYVAGPRGSLKARTAIACSLLEEALRRAERTY